MRSWWSLLCWPLIQDYQWLVYLSPSTLLGVVTIFEWIRLPHYSGCIHRSRSDGERTFGLDMQAVREQASDIILDKCVWLSQTWYRIYQCRPWSFITNGVEVDLLVGLVSLMLIRYYRWVDALGKEASSRAINEPKSKGSTRKRRELEPQKQNVKISVPVPASATEGENLSKIKVAQSTRTRREQEAEAERLAVAEKKNQPRHQKRLIRLHQCRGYPFEREKASQHADIVIPAQIEKSKIETLAEADAEKTDGWKKVKQMVYSLWWRSKGYFSRSAKQSGRFRQDSQ